MRVRELKVEYRPRQDLPAYDGRKPLTSPREAADFIRPILENEPVEVFIVVCLSTKLRVLCYHELSRGCLDGTTVHPREVFKAAILGNAGAVILGHNHPSGDPSPSPDDAALTRRFVECGELLGIQVVDSIIIGDGNYYSFKETGRFR